MPVTVRRRSLSALGAIGAIVLLALSGCASGPQVEHTDETTEVTVTVQGMHYMPDVIEVPVGNELVVTFTNTGDVMHDLVFANGSRTPHVAPGDSRVVEVGVVAADMDGWCDIGNHRAQGMELVVRAIG